MRQMPFFIVDELDQLAEDWDCTDAMLVERLREHLHWTKVEALNWVRIRKVPVWWYNRRYASLEAPR